MLQKPFWPVGTAKTGSRSLKCSWALHRKGGLSFPNTKATLMEQKRVKARDDSDVFWDSMPVVLYTARYCPVLYPYRNHLENDCNMKQLMMAAEKSDGGRGWHEYD